VKRIVFLGVLLLVAILFRLDFLFVVFYLFVLAYALSYLWVQNVGRSLAVERRLADHAFSGDRVRVRLVLKNGGWLPAPWLDVHERLPVQLATPPFFRHASSVWGKGRQDLAYELHCHDRGYYAIGPLTVRTGDLLGFARPRTLELGAEPLIVYPKVLPLDALGLPTHSPQVALPARAPLFQDPSRVMGVRDYQRGDSPRRLHWTATAKASASAAAMRLLVKQYQPAISRETMICLDLCREDYGRRNWVVATERAIVVAASLANHIVVRERLPVGLVTEAHDPRLGEGPVKRERFSLPPRAGQGQLMRVLEALAVAQVVGESTPAGKAGTEAGFAAMLRETARDLSWGATLAIVTGKESAALLDTVFYLRRAGFAVALILVQAGRPSKSRAAGGRMGVPVFRIWEESDLGGVLGQAPGARSLNGGRTEARRIEAGA
jgi:uncharacterized protein (DUF58 family)